MNRRLIPVLFALLPLWWGALHAQTGELEDYMSRGRELSKSGKLDQALPYFLLSLELAEIRFGLDDPALIPMIDGLAEVRETISKEDMAEPRGDAIGSEERPNQEERSDSGDEGESELVPDGQFAPKIH